MPVAAVFAVIVLYCAGDNVSAETCASMKVEPPHLVSMAECKSVAADIAATLEAQHPEVHVRGKRCLTLGDLLDAND